MRLAGGVIESGAVVFAAIVAELGWSVQAEGDRELLSFFDIATAGIPA